MLGHVIKLFRNHNVSVCGVKGSGKDLLFGNVIARRNKPYVSNLNYGYDFIKLDFDDLSMGGNNYQNLISGDIFRYEIPYPDGADIYLSDAGIYLPAQYVNELNKKYPYLALVQALTRQLNNSRFHTNTQSLGRVYDKIREQSDVFILCRWCVYIPLVNIVIQLVTVYDKYESGLNRVRPCRVRVPMLNAQARVSAQIYRDGFYNTHGNVYNKLLIYHNKSKHNTYYFRELFKNGKEKNSKIVT